MKKIMNNPSNIVDEMLQGMIVSHPDLIQRIPETGIINVKRKKMEKWLLFLRWKRTRTGSCWIRRQKGMLSAAICGEVFTSPTPDQILRRSRYQMKVLVSSW